MRKVGWRLRVGVRVGVKVGDLKVPQVGVCGTDTDTDTGSVG